MKLYIGPSGGGLVTKKGFNYVKEKGLDALEIAFTYKVFLNEKQAKTLGEIAKRLNLKLSVHASYYINLASQEKIKVNASIKRIIQSVKIASILNAKYVVFHAGYYMNLEHKKIYCIIRDNIKKIQRIMKEKKYLNVLLAPETTGKLSQFGSVDELINLSDELDVSFCIDFAHIYARNIGKIEYDKILTKIKKSKHYKRYKHIHCHFSGINYGLKGEKNHLITPDTKIKELLIALKKHNINATIINESPVPVRDSIKTKRILESLTFNS